MTEEPSMDVAQPQTITMNGCARCRKEHDGQMNFQPLTYPMEIRGIKLTHWASCPTNGEPILLAITERP